MKEVKNSIVKSVTFTFSFCPLFHAYSETKSNSLVSPGVILLGSNLASPHTTYLSKITKPKSQFYSYSIKDNSNTYRRVDIKMNSYQTHKALSIVPLAIMIDVRKYSRQKK